jgi:hypothetical protein
VIGCVADAVTPPQAPDLSPAFGKAATSGISVSSTLPRSGDKGKTLDVHVYGSGFTAGATAAWALHGVADPSKVRTNSTTVVSSTELIANITIAPDATIDYWDVQVAAAFCCKTGVGTELFEVTSAMPVGPGSALGVNDAGDIVGLFPVSSTLAHAYVVSGADQSFSDIGLQRAQAISQDGLVIAGGVDGSTGAPYAGVWSRAPGAPWPTAGTHLPDLPGMTQGSGKAFAVAKIPAEGVTVITGILTVPATPVYWESIDGVTWTSPARALPMPARYAASVNSVQGISASGDIAGQLQDPSGNSVAVVWLRNAGTYTAVILPRPSGYSVARLRAISPDGTIHAGNVRVSSTGKDVLAPAFWTRDANGVYTVRLLPTLTGANGGLGVAVYGVTVVGGQVRAVGTSPGATTGAYQHAVMWTWTVGGSDFHVRDMGGVGTKTDVTPYAINPAGTIAVGADGTGSIKWLLQP